MKNKIVFLITLKKYQLLKYYEKHIKKKKLKENIKYLKEEKQFEKVMTDIPDYINDVADQTASVIANDMKRMMIGNSSQPIDLSSVNVKINLNCGDEPGTESDVTNVGQAEEDDMGFLNDEFDDNMMDLQQEPAAEQAAEKEEEKEEENAEQTKT